MIPEESRFEPDPQELVEPPEGLPEGWQVGTPDPDDLGGPDPVWVCEESGDVIAPLGGLGD